MPEIIFQIRTGIIEDIRIMQGHLSGACSAMENRFRRPRQSGAGCQWAASVHNGHRHYGIKYEPDAVSRQNAQENNPDFTFW